jgi:hypothetical protein
MRDGLVGAGRPDSIAGEPLLGMDLVAGDTLDVTVLLNTTPATGKKLANGVKVKVVLRK